MLDRKALDVALLLAAELELDQALKVITNHRLFVNYHCYRIKVGVALEANSRFLASFRSSNRLTA